MNRSLSPGLLLHVQGFIFTTSFENECETELGLFANDHFAVVFDKDKKLDDRWVTSNQLFKPNSTWPSSSCSFLNQELGTNSGNGLR